MESEIRRADQRLTSTLGSLRPWESNPFEPRDPQPAMHDLRRVIHEADTVLAQAALNPKADVLEIRHLIAMRDVADGTLKAFEQRRGRP